MIVQLHGLRDQEFEVVFPAEINIEDYRASLLGRYQPVGSRTQDPPHFVEVMSAEGEKRFVAHHYIELVTIVQTSDEEEVEPPPPDDDPA